MKRLSPLFIALCFLFYFTSQLVSSAAGPTDCRLALSAEVRQTGIAQTNQDTKPTNQEAKTTAQDKKPAINLQDYVGRYEADPSMVENFILDVFIEKDELWIKPSHSPKRKLTAKGVVFRKEPVKTEAGKQALFEDTCGNLIQLYQARN